MAKSKVVVTDLGYPTYRYEREQVEAIGGELITVDCKTEDEVIEATRDADGILNRAVQITARAVENMQKCKVLARYGIGVDNVDIEACTKKGICVANVPDYCWEEVSDQAMALLLACARKVVSRDHRTRGGEWDIGSGDPIHRIQGKTLGLLGLGNIARVVARKAKPFGLRLISYDPFVSEEEAGKQGVELVDFEALLAQSDFLSLHLPLNQKTRHIISRAELEAMKPEAVLINTARGPIVDEGALVQALVEGRIAGAGLDVFEQEPPASDNPLFELENVVVTDHASWYSEESIVELQTKAAAEVCRVLQGDWPRSLVNPEVKKVIGKDCP